MTLRNGLALAIMLALGLLGGMMLGVRRARLPAVPNGQTTQKPAAGAPREISIQGRVEALHSIPVGTSIAGEIDSFSADIGQDVLEGQVLARISNQGLQTGYESAQHILQNAEGRLSSLETAISAARLEASRVHDESLRANEDLDRATREFKRQRTLNDAGATPRNTFEKSRKDYEAAKSEADGFGELDLHDNERVDALTKEYDLAKRTLEDKRKELEEAQEAVAATEIHAPVDGVVVAREGEIGETITAEEAAALFRIATDISAMQAVFTPDPSMKAGDAVTILFPDVPGEPIPAAIREIKNGMAAAEFTSPNAAIRPGMPCTVHATIK